MAIRLRATDRRSVAMEQRRYDDCGLDGDESDPVTTGKLNRLLRRIAIAHLEPNETAADLMRAHVQECAESQAKIEGGIVVLKWLMSICIAVGTALLIAWISGKLGLS